MSENVEDEDSLGLTQMEGFEHKGRRGCGEGWMKLQVQSPDVWAVVNHLINVLLRSMQNQLKILSMELT